MEQRIEKAFREKLKENMEQYIRGLLCLTSEELIGKAQEIAATQLCFHELTVGHYQLERIKYLLRFEEPLKVIRDQWVQESTGDHSLELDHVMWVIQDTRDAERDYALNRTWLSIEESGQTFC